MWGIEVLFTFCIHAVVSVNMFGFVFLRVQLAICYAVAELPEVDFIALFFLCLLLCVSCLRGVVIFWVILFIRAIVQCILLMLLYFYIF